MDTDIYKVHNAVKRQDHKKVKRLIIKTKININFEDANDDGNTLLHTAVQRSSLKVVQVLLEHGARNSPNLNFKTPLSMASKLDNRDKFTLLSEYFKDQSDPTTVAEPDCKASKITYHRISGQHVEKHEGTDYKTLTAQYFSLRCQIHFKAESFNLTFNMKEAGSFKDIVLNFTSPLYCRSYMMFVQVVDKEELKAKNKYDNINLIKHFHDYLNIRKFYSTFFNRSFSTSKVILAVWTSASIYVSNEFASFLEPFDIADDDVLKSNTEGKGFSFKNCPEIFDNLLNSANKQIMEEVCSKEEVSPTEIITDFLVSFNVYYNQANVAGMKDNIMREITKVKATSKTDRYELDVQATFEKNFRQIEEYRTKEGTVEFLTQQSDILEKAKTFKIVNREQNQNDNALDGFTYSRRPGTSAIRGQWYESQLLALLLIRLIASRCPFYMASNMDGIGKFDDICMRYCSDQDKNQKKMIFVQNKHRDDSEQREAKMNKHVQKSFKSYLSIREKFSRPNTNVLFQGNLENLELEMIILNQAKCDTTFLKKAEQNPLLYINDSETVFKYDENDKMIDNLLKMEEKLKMNNILRQEGKPVNDQNYKSIARDFLKAYRLHFLEVTEEEMIKLIMKEMNTNDYVFYRMYQDFVHEYYRSAGVVNFLTNECNFIEKVKLKMNHQSLLQNLTDICLKSSQQFDLEFTEESFQLLGLDEILSDKRIFNIYSDAPALTSAKICQYLAKTDKNPLAIVDLGEVRFDCDEIISIFTNQNEFKRLIVHRSGKTAQLNPSQMRTALTEGESCIILISETELMTEVHQIQDSWVSFADLTKECQNILLNNKTVLFRGKPFKLVDLIGEPYENYSIPRQCITGFILQDMLQSDSFEVAPIKNTQIPNYIERSYKKFNKVKSFQFNKKFEIVEDSKNITQNDTDLVIISNDEKIHKQICFLFPSRNVHWFRKHQDHFLWQSSSNSVANLRELLELGDEKIPIVNCDSFIDRVVLLAAEPGMGKSTLLTELEQQHEVSNDLMVVRINLLECAKFFATIQNITPDLEIAKHFLSQYIAENTITNSELRCLKQKVLERFFYLGKVILLADGFDEIAPNYTKKVIELLNVVKGHVKKLVITTRSNGVKEVLEKSLSVYSHTLVPLTKKDFRSYLEMSWKFAVKYPTQFEEFFTALLETFTGNEGFESFISIPLHIKMITTMLKEPFKNYIVSRSNESLNTLEAELNVCSLFEKFMEMKLTNIYHEQNNAVVLIKPLNNNYYELIEKSHKRLALCAIFDEEIVKLLLSNEELAEMKHDIENLETGKEKGGFITRIVTGKPQFTHFLFADYFAAKAVFDTLINVSIESFGTIVEHVLIGYLIAKNKLQICRFIQAQALDDVTFKIPSYKACSLLQSFISRNFKFDDRCYGMLLSLNESSIPHHKEKMGKIIASLSNDGKLALLKAASLMGYSNIVTFVTMQLGLKFLHKELVEGFWGQSPLYLATKSYCSKVVKYLVKEVKYDVNWLAKENLTLLGYLLKRRKYSYIVSLLSYGISELAKPNGNGYVPLYEALRTEGTPQCLIEALLNETDVDFFNKSHLPYLDWFLLQHDPSLTCNFLNKGFIIEPSLMKVGIKKYEKYSRWEIMFGDVEQFKINVFDPTWIDRMSLFWKSCVGFHLKSLKEMEKICCILQVLILDVQSDLAQFCLRAVIASENCYNIKIDVEKLPGEEKQVSLWLNGMWKIDLSNILDSNALLNIIYTIENRKLFCNLTNKTVLINFIMLNHLPDSNEIIQSLVSDIFDHAAVGMLFELLNEKVHLNLPSKHELLELFDKITELLKEMKKQHNKWLDIMNLIQNRSVEKVDSLLHALTDKALQRNVLNFLDEKCNSLLHYAIYNQDSDIVHMLLKNGADANISHVTPVNNSSDEEYGEAPLHVAARDGNAKIVRLLLEHGAKNIVTKHNITPSFMAAHSGH